MKKKILLSIVAVLLLIGITAVSSVYKKKQIREDIQYRIETAITQRKFNDYDFSGVLSGCEVGELDYDDEFQEFVIEKIKVLHDEKDLKAINELLKFLERKFYKKSEVNSKVQEICYNNKNIFDKIKFIDEGLKYLEYYRIKITQEELDEGLKDVSLNDKLDIKDILLKNNIDDVVVTFTQEDIDKEKQTCSFEEKIKLDLRIRKIDPEMIVLTQNDVDEEIVAYSFEEKVELAKYFNENNIKLTVVTVKDKTDWVKYAGEKISTASLEEIEYVEKGLGEDDYLKNIEPGYYDNEENKMDSMKRKASSAGFVTVYYRYHGDFAVSDKEIEYVDELYQIKTKYSHDLYFRGWKLNEIDYNYVEMVEYAPPFLFCKYFDDIEVFILDEAERIVTPETINSIVTIECDENISK